MKALIKEFEDNIKQWTYVTADDNLKKVYAEDRKDLRKGLRLIKQGKTKDALSHLQYLDTIVREQVPVGLWDALEDACEVQRSSLNIS